jgi:hypothetical protein
MIAPRRQEFPCVAHFAWRHEIRTRGDIQILLAKLSAPSVLRGIGATHGFSRPMISRSEHPGNRPVRHAVPESPVAM